MRKFFNKTPRQLLNENVVETFKKFLKETPNSVLFWNGLLYILFFAVWIFAGSEWVGVISCIGSILFFGIIVDDCDSQKDLHYWIPLTILFWCLIAFMLVLGFFYLIYIYTLEPFNKWLDKPKKQKDGSNQTVC